MSRSNGNNRAAAKRRDRGVKIASASVRQYILHRHRMAGCRKPQSIALCKGCDRDTEFIHTLSMHLKEWCWWSAVLQRAVFDGRMFELQPPSTGSGDKLISVQSQYRRARLKTCLWCTIATSSSRVSMRKLLLLTWCCVVRRSAGSGVACAVCLSGIYVLWIMRAQTSGPRHTTYTGYRLNSIRVWVMLLCRHTCWNIYILMYIRTLTAYQRRTWGCLGRV